MATAFLANRVVTVDTLREQHRVTAEVKAAAWAKITAAEARLAGLNRDMASSDLSARVIARRELPKLESEIDELMVVTVTADRAEAAARAAVKEAVHDEIHGLMRPVVARAAALFLELRTEMNALGALEDRERNESGGGAIGDSLVWPSIMSGNDRFQPLLDSWLARCSEYFGPLD